MSVIFPLFVLFALGTAAPLWSARSDPKREVRPKPTHAPLARSLGLGDGRSFPSTIIPTPHDAQSAISPVVVAVAPTPSLELATPASFEQLPAEQIFGCPVPRPEPTPTGSTLATSTPASLPPGSFPTESPPNFKALEPVELGATIINSCNYPLWVDSVGGLGCPPRGSVQIAPGEYFQEELRNCTSGGVSLKVAKDASMGNIMQVEYANNKTKPAGNDAEDWLYYNLSLLDCLDGFDASNCPGHEDGLQLGSGPSCPVFACQPGEECWRMMYWEPEFGHRVNAPVGYCSRPNGLVAEFCAGRNARV